MTVPTEKVKAVMPTAIGEHVFILGAVAEFGTAEVILFLPKKMVYVREIPECYGREAIISLGNLRGAGVGFEILPAGYGIIADSQDWYSIMGFWYRYDGTVRYYNTIHGRRLLR